MFTILFFKLTQKSENGEGLATDGDISCKPCQAYSKVVSQSDDNEDAVYYDYI